MGAEPRLGFRVVGTTKSGKGHCIARHKAGQQIELSGHNTGGMCGFFYHEFSLMSLCSNLAAASRSSGGTPT
jgi:hypothetical protein